MTCCLGAYIAIPDLPPSLLSAPVTFNQTQAVYWERLASLSSRSIRPDPGPPRSIA
jgi:hypothetical protein